MNGGSVNKGFIETLLKKSDFPYIITLLLGLVAFGVTSIVDSITSTPVVMMEEEYVQPSKNKKGWKVYELKGTLFFASVKR